MKKDITQLPVENVAVVISPRTGQASQELWDVYLVNQGNEPLSNVIISCRGYGELDGRDKTTTTLRYFFETVPAASSVLVEPIQPILFGIVNEYWVSFNQGDQMLDKKFVFAADSINAEACGHVAILERIGVAA
ncbi:MAG: hypothetical protein AAFU67_13460 [Bacteroidota bacterium]